MFITRKEYERQIKKAKKKATKKAIYIMDTQKEMQDIRREMYRICENVNSEQDRRFRELEKDIAKIKGNLAME